MLLFIKFKHCVFIFHDENLLTSVSTTVPTNNYSSFLDKKWKQALLIANTRFPSKLLHQMKVISHLRLKLQIELAAQQPKQNKKKALPAFKWSEQLPFQSCLGFVLLRNAKLVCNAVHHSLNLFFDALPHVRCSHFTLCCQWIQILPPPLLLGLHQSDEEESIRKSIKMRLPIITLQGPFLCHILFWTQDLSLMNKTVFNNHLTNKISTCTDD